MIGLKITLRNADSSSVVLNVQHEDIANAAVIVYEGKYYVYGGMSGRVFQDIHFNEVNEPVKIEKQ